MIKYEQCKELRLVVGIYGEIATIDYSKTLHAPQKFASVLLQVTSNIGHVAQQTILWKEGTIHHLHSLKIQC